MAVLLRGYRRAIRQNDEHRRQALKAKSDLLHIAERPLRIFFTYFMM
jgi:hypothetical protein